MKMNEKDPRYFQIICLVFLLTYLVLNSYFDIKIDQVFLYVLSCLSFQWMGELFQHRTIRGIHNWQSPLISGLSLSLLLRTDSFLLAFIASFLTISSKFVLREEQKHFFNPTNFSIVLLLGLSNYQVWVSPAVWGQKIGLDLVIILLGSYVCFRAKRLPIVYGFLSFYFLLKISRHLWLGDPLSILIHSSMSGALLIFCFFMLSDPKTTPQSLRGQLLFALSVALISGFIDYILFERNGIFYALFLTSAFFWATTLMKRNFEYRRVSMVKLMTMLLFLASGIQTWAFCGFYVSKADTKLFNQASKVVMVRDDNKTILTMANDYQGEPKEFAMVIPVPEVLERGQINVANNAVIEHLDAYTAPRLVEYFDPDPCQMRFEMESMAVFKSERSAKSRTQQESAKKLGVKIEAQYTVEEYDILILSAKESGGLVKWLKENDYKIPEGAEPVVDSYLKQGMKFFVAKVNLKEQVKLGYSYLRPLQVAYESSKFMLPIRLGTVNAKGDQELFIFTLSRKGRIETTNYRTVKIPTDTEVPSFLKDSKEFTKFYQDMFKIRVEREGKSAVHLEYAWDMGWCDPCAADPLSDKELRDLGVFWVGKPEEGKAPGFVGPTPRRIMPNQGANVFVTRLHLRYNKNSHPEDLFFQQTGDRNNYQGRYVMRHAWKGEASQCPQAVRYFQELPKRQEKKAEALANLTGWDISEIRKKMSIEEPEKKEDKDSKDKKPWWKDLWSSN